LKQLAQERSGDKSRDQIAPAAAVGLPSLFYRLRGSLGASGRKSLAVNRLQSLTPLLSDNSTNGPERARSTSGAPSKVGTLSAKKTDDGGFAIDPDDLFAVFETNQANQPPMAEDAVASVEASESPETSATAETVETELKGLLELPAEAAASYELRQNRDERPAVELAERNAQLDGPAAERARVEKMAKYAALADEHYKPWWRRLVGWIRTRRGRAARKRLRERL
jgi:hypothetical protein